MDQLSRALNQLKSSLVGDFMLLTQAVLLFGETAMLVLLIFSLVKLFRASKSNETENLTKDITKSVMYGIAFSLTGGLAQMIHPANVSDKFGEIVQEILNAFMFVMNVIGAIGCAVIAAFLLFKGAIFGITVIRNRNENETLVHDLIRLVAFIVAAVSFGSLAALFVF